MDREQSRELLALWSNLPVADLTAPMDGIISECGRLPLALSVVGAMLRGAEPEFWEDTLALLRKADLSAIQQQLPPGQESFFKAVEVSFKSLAPEMQERYKALAVLPADMVTPLPILEVLWAVSDAEARRISRHFVDRSIAQRAEEPGSIRLHNLQVDYVRAQSADHEALSLIRGAVRLSSHVLERDPTQFASQMAGRLLLHRNLTAVQEFTDHLAGAAREPWLRPLWPALDPPGTALLRTLAGHPDLVYGIAIAPDGRRASLLLVTQRSKSGICRAAANYAFSKVTRRRSMG